MIRVSNAFMASSPFKSLFLFPLTSYAIIVYLSSKIYIYFVFFIIFLDMGVPQKTHPQERKKGLLKV